MKNISGQLSLFDDIEKHNCNTCDVEWCSLACFYRRGYVRYLGKWIRDVEGNISRRGVEHRECKINVADFN